MNARTFVAGMALCALPGLIPSAQAAPFRSHGRGEPQVARCIRDAADGHLWLEKTLWGLRDQEGGWLGAEVANADGSHDLGPLQVNSWWVAKLAAATGRPAVHIRHWLIHDACFNVDTARWIFLAALRSTKDYWKAIGVYHSPTGWRQRCYIANVASRLKARFGSTVFGPSHVGGQRPGTAGQ